MKKTFTFLFALFSLFLLVACETEKATYIVSIYINDSLVNNYAVVEGEIFSKDELTSMPVGEDFIFWSTEKDGIEYTFTLPIDGNLNLYAVYEDGNTDPEPNPNLPTLDVNLDLTKYNKYYQGFGLESLLELGINGFNKSSEIRSALNSRIKSGADIRAYKSSEWSVLKKADLSLNNPGMVWKIYDGGLISVNSSGGNSGQWNKEHVVPQNWLKNISASAMAGDQQNLRACDVGINSARGNNRFADGSGKYKDYGSSFFPGDKHMGDVARILMYMMVLHPSFKITTMIQGENPWDILLRWHTEDPVDAFEVQRNQVIFESFQKNRNPFIDYPGLVYWAWADQYHYAN